MSPFEIVYSCRDKHRTFRLFFFHSSGLDFLFVVPIPLFLLLLSDLLSWLMVSVGAILSTAS